MANEQSTMDEQVHTGLSAGLAEDESALGEAEPWEFWETKLVMWSILIGIGCLVVLGAIINLTILNK